MTTLTATTIINDELLRADLFDEGSVMNIDDDVIILTIHTVFGTRIIMSDGFEQFITDDPDEAIDALVYAFS